jgi:broad specificity polyphosphatase/5'/3'-nucleotidase SurE
MRSFLLLAAALPLTQGVRIVQSNDDGWSEINLRTLFDVLNTAGHEVVLSGPAENQSGTGLCLCHSFTAHTHIIQDPLMPLQKRLMLMVASTTLVLAEVYLLEPMLLTRV